MQKENINVSSHKVSVRDLPLALSLNKEKKQPCFTKQAAEAYYLANGQYENDMSVLDIQFDGCEPTHTYWCKTPKIIFDILTSPTRLWDVNATLYDDGGVMNCYGMFLDHTTNPGVKYCGARANSSVANQVCKSLGGTTYTVSHCLSAAPVNQSCNIYILP